MNEVNYINNSRRIKNLLPLSYISWYKPLLIFNEDIFNHEISSLMLLSVEKLHELASLLGITFFELENAINNPNYKVFFIRKKAGGLRLISSPDNKLKVLQKRLNYYLQSRYLCIKPNYVHGFITNPRYLNKKCNIVENAKAHTGKKHILNFDIQNYFPSITVTRVRNLFLSSIFLFNDDIATSLALLVTNRGSLPVGAPTSPVISNFICLEFDHDMKNLADFKEYTYTRYADDLTLSSNTPFSQNDLYEINAIVENHGFKINQKKTRIVGSNRKQTVTGLVVNQKVGVERRMLKKIRAIVHDCKVNGFDSAVKRYFGINEISNHSINVKFYNLLSGYISFIGQVRGKDDKLYAQLKMDFYNAVKKRYSRNN